MSPTLSIVVPTLNRPGYIAGLLENLGHQSRLPDEVIVVDGASPTDRRTEDLVDSKSHLAPYELRYLRSDQPGTSRQRNFGIAAARGELISFLDDDIRPKPDFFEIICDEFSDDHFSRIGGICGYIENLYQPMFSLTRWRIYRALRLFKTIQPGTYDRSSGYPINIHLQDPFDGLRRVDFFGGGCGVWRREVFQSGIRFFEGFSGYGILEDCHLALRAESNWDLFQCGSARCIELRAPGGRGSAKEVGYKGVFNYWYVFRDVCGEISFPQSFRFWSIQVIHVIESIFRGILRRDVTEFRRISGQLRGIIDCLPWRFRQKIKAFRVGKLFEETPEGHAVSRDLG